MSFEALGQQQAYEAEVQHFQKQLRSFIPRKGLTAQLEPSYRLARSPRQAG